MRGSHSPFWILFYIVKNVTGVAETHNGGQEHQKSLRRTGTEIGIMEGKSHSWIIQVHRMPPVAEISLHYM